MDKRKQKELISVRVTGKFKRHIEKIAEAKEMTPPDLIRFVLSNYIEDYEMKNNKDNTSK